MQFSQNHKASYGASFKAKKDNVALIKMPNIPLLVRICLVYPIIQTTFSKVTFYYVSQNALVQKIKKTHKQNVMDGQTDRQTDRWTDEQGWLFKTPSVKMVIWSCFSKIQELIFFELNGCELYMNYIWIIWLWALWKGSLQEKGTQPT